MAAGFSVSAGFCFEAATKLPIENIASVFSVNPLLSRLPAEKNILPLFFMWAAFCLQDFVCRKRIFVMKSDATRFVKGEGT